MQKILFNLKFMGYLFLFFALVLNATANILVKIGSHGINDFVEFGFIKGLINNYILIVGIFLFALNVIFYIIALSKINLSIAYPVLAGGGFLIITIVSFLYLKEQITISHILGMLFLIIGIILIVNRP